MGSLMAGWDSLIQDPKDVKFSRNKSLTKEEIEAFWKCKKLKEEEHLRDISLLSPRTQKKIIFEEAAAEMENNSSLEKNGWWISTNSAFLNEPPVLAQPGTAQKYAAQFHVADAAGSTRHHGPAGVSA